MNKYNISRYEKNLDHDGNIVSIFLAVSVLDGEEGTTYEHWLSGEEMALVLEDEANLKPILEKCYAEAELKLENEIATRPMPSIYPLQKEGKKEEIEATVKVADITSAKAVIVAEKLQAEVQPIVNEEPLEKINP